MNMKQWRSIFFVLSIFVLSILPICAAERVEIPSSLNPVGSGARAMGMGGAFIAIADDATAASWNPGGLIQLEKPEISAVFDYTLRREDNTFPSNPESSGLQSIYDRNLNYLSGAYPFTPPFGDKNRNMIVSLNYQHLYDFSREWRYDNSSYKQQGAIYALGLAYCAQITIDLSVGFTINYWGDFLFKNKWEQKYDSVLHIKNKEFQSINIEDKKEELSFNGWNANFGFLWKLNEHMTIGGILKTPFTANISHSIIKRNATIYQNPEQIYNYPSDEKFDEKMTMPMSYGIGIAYRFSDNFTISADIYKTLWNDFKLENGSGEKVSPITGTDTESDPTTCFRLGVEYLIVGEKIVIPIRAGIFYDPAPAKASPDDYYGFSLGSGISCKWFSFDLAYQFRFGNNVGSSMFQNFDFYQDVREHRIYTSLIYYF